MKIKHIAVLLACLPTVLYAQSGWYGPYRCRVVDPKQAPASQPYDATLQIREGSDKRIGTWLWIAPNANGGSFEMRGKGLVHDTTFAAEFKSGQYHGVMLYTTNDHGQTLQGQSLVAGGTGASIDRIECKSGGM